MSDTRTDRDELARLTEERDTKHAAQITERRGVPGAFFAVTGKADELHRILIGIEENEGRLTADGSMSLDLWQEMREEWFRIAENERDVLATLIVAHGDDSVHTQRLTSAILAAGFSRQIPRPSTIAVPHTPEEIWAAADVWCDLDFWDRTDLEYTDDGVLHLASNVNVTPDEKHMPDHLRPDIGEDRL